MKYSSEKKLFYSARKAGGFSLMEAVAAIIIVGTVLVGIITIINNAVSASANTMLKMQALQVARENLENLIAQGSAIEGIEYGTSEQYPAIQWQNTVETFYEPLTNRMWARAICAAEYMDSDGETQTIEFTHWLTGLTKKQIVELLKEKDKETEFLELTDQVITSIEEAAEYAGVDEDTIVQWVEEGMPVAEDGSLIKDYVDLYKETEGSPTIDQKRQTQKQVENKLNPPEPEPEMPDTDYQNLPFDERIEFLLKYDPAQITFEELMKYWFEYLK